MKILVIEDDVKLSEALVHILKKNNYIVDAVFDGKEGLYYASNHEYDAIVLDIMLPKMNGFDVIRKLRKQKIATPTLMLTAKSEVDDKVNGLDSGADDYMVKPFEPKELLARLRAMCRRKGEVMLEEITFGDVVININTFVMSKGDKSVNLSNKEFQTINILIQNFNQVISKEQLIVKVWGTESEATDNNVEAYISFIRRKLKYISSSVSIKAIRMIGYKIEVKTYD